MHTSFGIGVPSISDETVTCICHLACIVVVIHPTEQSIEEEDRIANSPQSMNDRGWRRTRDRIPGVFTPRRLVRLKRVSDTAVEGVFTCHIPGDIPTPVSVGIYYPSEIMLMLNVHSMH